MAIRHKTPMLDELEKGPWPSFVTDIKRAATEGSTEMVRQMSEDLLGVLELSYEHKEGHWKHGGIVGVLGYGGGVIGRYVDVPEDFPGVEHFHTMRVNQPSSKFYTTKALRTICDIWDKHGSGLTNMHGSTGDIILLGTRTEELEPTFAELTKNGFDLGGSGSALRTPACCVGMARCQWACIDTQKICYGMTMEYQDEMHRPAWPYKFKIKVSGCSNDCVAAIARSDFSIIGTWKGPIQMDQAGIKAYAAGEYSANGGAFGPDVKVDIAADVVGKCPQSCISYDGKELAINNADCVRCMNCINVMPRALKPGKERGCSVLMGSKAPILDGAQISSVVVPWIPADDDLLDNLNELFEKVIEWWEEEGKNRERLGELMQRLGYRELLKALELDFDPRMIKEPRSNPYIFYQEDEVPGGFERDAEGYRSRHKA